MPGFSGVFQFAVEMANYGKPLNLMPAPMAVLTARARELKIFLALKPKTKLCVQYRKVSPGTMESSIPALSDEAYALQSGFGFYCAATFGGSESDDFPSRRRLKS